MTVTKEQAMEMFSRDLKILMDELRGMQSHYRIGEWEAFVFLRKPDCPESYVVEYAAADDGFAKQIVQLHAAATPVESTAGADGRCCTHHDDDPAHGKECYDAREATALSLAEALSYCGPLREFNGGTTTYIFGFDLSKAIGILTKYFAATPPETPSAAAMRAAEEIQDWNERGEGTGTHIGDVAHIAAIITRNLAATTSLSSETAVGGEALLPCPFCSSFANLRFVGDSGRGSEGDWWIGCSRNHSRATTKEEAIRRWNTRSGVKETMFSASAPDEDPCATAGRHVCGPMDRETAKAVKNAAEAAITTASATPATAAPVPVAVDDEGRWRPIDTAPKDGTRVLLLRGEYVWIDEWWKGNGENSGWASLVAWTQATDKATQRPTHWMPLPTPLGTTALRSGDKS